MHEVQHFGGGRLAALLVPLFAALTALLLPATASAANSIYWSNFNGAISQANLDGSGGSDLATGAATVNNPLGTAIDSAAGKIYWPNFGADTISQASLDGSGGGDLTITGTASVSQPSGIAIDPAAGKIYWANFGDDTISRADLDGMNAVNLSTAGATADDPVAVAIDPAANRIYWSNFDLNNSTGDAISYANLDGTGGGADLVTTGATVDDPYGVAVDTATGKIYWSNSNAGGPISYANLDGTGGTDLVTTGASNPQLPQGVALDPGAGRIYWTNFSNGIISYANLDGTGGGADLSTTGATQNNANLPSLLKAPTGINPPTISGGPEAGKELSCGQGSWAADLLPALLYRTPASFAYQWQRNGWLSTDASSATFTPTEPGSYVCRVTATNRAGSTLQTSAQHRIETPKTTITRKPRAKRARKKAKGKANRKRKGRHRWVFRFTDEVPGVSFYCKLDRGPFKPCSSPRAYRHLARGRHRFQVKSRDAAGNQSKRQTAHFSVGRTRG